MGINMAFYNRSLTVRANKILSLIKEAGYTVTGIYLFLILVLFPLYVEDYYWKMASCKWKFYLCVTVPYLAVMLFCMFATGIFKRPGNRTGQNRPDTNDFGISAPGEGRERARGMNACDWCALLYGVCVLIPLLSAKDRQAVWTGADGWYMGAAAQLLFLAVYFVISRSRISVPLFLGCSAAGSGICFLIGILQRLGWDVLHMYDEMEFVLLSDFLSTIGNRTWMSGYACVVFPIGVYLFWQAREPRDRFLWGLYCALAFAGLAATYSDSAYMGLGIVFLSLWILSVGSREKLFSFLQVLCIWFGQALLMCGLRAIRGNRVRDARGITRYVYDWRWMLAGFAVCLLLAVWAARSVRRCSAGKADVSNAAASGKASVPVNGAASGSENMRNRIARERRLRRACLAAAVLGGALMCLLVVLNTSGVLERWFHVTIHNPYLYFDEKWGDWRGWTWRMTCRMFGELPLWQKLFGVGADCFVRYAYGSPEYIVEFGRVWGDVILTNAHNEWLNMFFCQGIVGGLAYLGIFVCGAVLCLQNRGKSDTWRRRESGGGAETGSGGAAGSAQASGPVVCAVGQTSGLPARVIARTSDLPACAVGQMPDAPVQAIGFCVLAYLFHNFFCYQQICATGLIFVLLGVAGAFLRGRYETGQD